MTADRPEIIATVNLERATRERLRRYVAAGATLLRMNGAFVRAADVPAAVAFLRTAAAGRARVILDLPGYKLRLLGLERPVRFTRGTPVVLERRWLNYADAFDLFDEGTSLRLNDGRVVLTIRDRSGDRVTCAASRPGVLTPGKGIHLECRSYRPATAALSQLDHDLVRAAVAEGVDCVGLSFAHNADDVLHAQRLCHGSSTSVVPKIESKESVKRTGEIVELASEVIIDRGDLAAEIGLDKVWRAQREVIATCKRSGVRVYVATQVLSSMVRHALPSIAEIDSLYSLMHEGIDGIQLSEETSVGRHAVECVRMVRAIFDSARPAAGGLRKVV